MPETFGPYETERDTYGTPLHSTWLALPLGGLHEFAASRQRSLDLKRDHLLAACRAAGVELGAYDEQIIAWLAGFETSAVQVFIGLISRAYAAGRSQGQTEDCANCGVPGPCQPIGCDAGRHLPGCFWAAAEGGDDRG